MFKASFNEITTAGFSIVKQTFIKHIRHDTRRKTRMFLILDFIIAQFRHILREQTEKNAQSIQLVVSSPSR